MSFWTSSLVSVLSTLNSLSGSRTAAFTYTSACGEECAGVVGEGGMCRCGR